MNRSAAALLLLSLWAAAASVAAGGGGAAAEPREPFRFLRIGEVRPRGWLLEQIRTDATNGYGPLLDKLTDRIEAAVFDSRNRTELAKPKIGADWWNGETTGNWLDGLIRTAYLSGDEAVKRRADVIVAQIFAMRDEDGYLGIYPRAKRFESPIGVQNGELWTQACLYRGLLAYYELTGRADVLAAVQRAAKLTISKYGPARPYWRATIGRGGPGHNIMFVDVCEWLHRLTGDPSYVEFARFLYDGYCAPTDVSEADVQLRNLSDLQKPFHGHGAHVMEHLRVPLFLAHATGEAEYRAAADNFFPKAVRHLAAGGACISDEDIVERHGSPYIGSEYCTSLEFLHALQSGVEKSGRGQLADAIEVLAFNSAEGARQRDGRAIQYCTVDNQFEATAKGCGGRMKLSPTHEDVAVCCPVTALKFFPYFVNELWMKTAAGDGLVAVNYAPNELETRINGVAVRIESETGYPFEDEVRMTITPEKPLSCGIRLRIPGWAGRMNVESPGASTADDGGWRVLTKEWKAGDRITIAFRPDVERKTMANGEVYWKRGPLVYALPIPAERKQIKGYSIAGFADYEYTPKAGALWDYAVDEEDGTFEFGRTNAQGNPWVASPVRLTGSLVNRKTGQPEPVALEPMGVHLLRRVAFPDMRAVRAREGQARLLQGKLNLARQVRVEASSTARGYAPQAIVDGVAGGFPENPTAEWASDHGTMGAKVKLTWEKPVIVGGLWLFDRPNLADHVQGARVAFSDGTSARAGELPNDGTTPFRLGFPEKTIMWLEVIVTKVGSTTRNAGFSEIAIFDKAPDEGSLPSSPAAAAAKPAPGRPNILLYIADDMSWLHTSIGGFRAVKTPNFDRVASAGARFTHAFCSSPSCTPSRGALLAGQDFCRLREGASLLSTLPSDIPVYPDILEQLGYVIGLTGKGWAPGDWRPGGRSRNPAGTTFRSFSQFIAALPAGRPFCFWAGSADPHRPYAEGSGVNGGIDPAKIIFPPILPDTPEIRRDLADYLFEVQRFDSGLGELLATLEKNRLLEDTLVVVTSDNGMPFPRGKCNLYDWGVRVPLAISWQGRIPAGRVIDDFVSLVDLAPTFLEAAGQTPPACMTGRSLMPLLLTGKAGQIDPQRGDIFVGRERHDVFREEQGQPVGYPMRAIRDCEFLYIRNFKPERLPGGDDVAANQDNDRGPAKTFVATHRDDPGIRPYHERAYGQRPAEELYDLKRDPAQHVNSAADPACAGTLARLRDRLDQRMTALGDPRRQGSPDPDIFDRYPIHNTRKSPNNEAW